MVGTGRFELPTPRTPSECSTRLSHVPTVSCPALARRWGTSILHEAPLGSETIGTVPVRPGQQGHDPGHARLL